MIKFYENDIKFPKNDILRCSVPTFAQNIWVEIFLESIFWLWMSLKWVGSGCSSFWTVVSVSKGWGLREFLALGGCRCLRAQKVLPGGLCRRWLKFPEAPGGPGWWTCNMVIMTIHEAYLVALGTTITLTCVPVMAPGFLDTFPWASWDTSWAYWNVSWTIFDGNIDILPPDYWNNLG